MFLFTVTLETLVCGDGGWTLAMRIDGKKVCSFIIMEYLSCELSTTITLSFSQHFRKPTIMISSLGATNMSTTFPEKKLTLTQKRPNYQPTGTHPSLRSTSV